jgi:integrase
MAELQQLTGMRSQNVTAMRPCDLDRSREVWEYVPAEHKAAWRDKKLFIALGPKCQEILRPFLERPPDSYLFSPIEAQAWRSQQRRAARKTPLTPSQKKRTPLPLSKRERPPADRYTPASYRRAIRYGIRLANKAIDKANKKRPEHKQEPHIPAWTPHQLRHNAATYVRRTFNAEGARVYLGHSHLKTTEIYAERDIELAREIARRMG